MRKTGESFCIPIHLGCDNYYNPACMAQVNLFTQIISHLDRNVFRGLVREKGTDKHQKGFHSWTHLVSMIFAQFAKVDSVRDISNGLRSASGNLNHLGISKAPSKSSVSYQNKNRDWTLFQDYYLALYANLREKAAFKQVKFRIKSKILLLDSSLISLCLNTFDWAQYKTKKGAIKLHTLLNYEDQLPAFIHVSDGKMGDNQAAFVMKVPAGSVTVMDRYYNDFSLLNVWDSREAFFVVRHKSNIAFKTVKELDLPEDRHHHILKDEIIQFTGSVSKKKYPKKLRRVASWDEENNQTIELLTNQMSWTANTISELYRSRWDIEMFFRDIKQLLHIKSFYGTTHNAVMIQIWTAMITVLLLKYLKEMAKYGWRLANLMAFIRINLLVKISLAEWLDEPFEPPKNDTGEYRQGDLFEDWEDLALYSQ